MSEANDKDHQPPANNPSPENAKPKDAAGDATSKKSQNKATADSVASASANKALTTTPKTKKADKKSSTANTAKKPEKSRRGMVLVIVIIVLLVIFGAVGGTSYWVYQQNQQLAQSLTTLSSQQGQQNNNLDTLQTQLNKLNQQQQSLEAKATQTQNAQRTAKLSIEQVSAQLQTMATEKGKDPLLWRLSEVDYLLSIANHRLLLERDVMTAKTALQDADRRLKAIGDPALIPIREKISNEISQLNSAPLPDIAGMAAQLSSLIAGIGQLPLVKKEMNFEGGTSESTDPESGSVAEGAKKLLNDIVSGLFEIQRTEQAIEPLLTPGEKQYLSQNLSLKLEQARIALLHADTPVFQRNLNDIKHWVERYFDQESASVTNVLQTVQQLQSIELKPQLPDISASLRELRSWIKRQQQTVGNGVSQIQNPDTLTQRVSHGNVKNSAPLSNTSQNSGSQNSGSQNNVSQNKAPPSSATKDDAMENKVADKVHSKVNDDDVIGSVSNNVTNNMNNSDASDDKLIENKIIENNGSKNKVSENKVSENKPAGTKPKPTNTVAANEDRVTTSPPVTAVDKQQHQQVAP